MDDDGGNSWLKNVYDGYTTDNGLDVSAVEPVTGHGFFIREDGSKQHIFFPDKDLKYEASIKLLQLMYKTTVEGKIVENDVLIFSRGNVDETEEYHGDLCARALCVLKDIESKETYGKRESEEQRVIPMPVNDSFEVIGGGVATIDYSEQRDAYFAAILTLSTTGDYDNKLLNKELILPLSPYFGGLNIFFC